MSPSGNTGENAEVDAEVERAMQTLFSTPMGQDVKVAPAQLTSLMFDTVTSPGFTSVAATPPSPGTTIAAGFQVVDNLTYDVITTASIRGR